MSVKYIVILFILYLSSANAERHLPFPQQISGVDILNYFATTCSPKTWTPFSELAEKENWRQLNLNIPLAEYDSAKKRITMHDYRGTLQVSEQKILKVKIGSKTFEDADPCGLILKIQKSKQSSAHLFSLLLNEAQAANLVEESRILPNTVLVAGTLAGVGCTILLAVPTFFTSSVACILLAGAFVTPAGKSRTAKDYAEEVINNKFQLACTKSSITLTSENKDKELSKKLTFTKNPEGKYELKIAYTDNGNILLNNNDSHHIEKSKTFLTELTKRCQTPEQAKLIESEFFKQKEIIRTRINQPKPQEPIFKKRPPTSPRLPILR